MCMKKQPAQSLDVFCNFYDYQLDFYSDGQTHDVFVSVSGDKSSKENAAGVVEAIHKNGPVHTIINVAGGFTMGPLSDLSVFDDADKMYNACLGSALISAHVAAKTLVPKGSLILTGAEAAKGPTPALLAYGTAKAATHHLVASLADTKAAGLPDGTFVAAICPVTLDTPSNRKNMPDADFKKWTPLQSVADRLLAWSNGSERPPQGTLFKV